MPPARTPFYEQVYDWFPDRTFDRVLIVGAGSGTDVAVALAHGAKHVDAVEIDPSIQEIGIEKHPDRPYDDPRVDARRRRRPGVPSRSTDQLRPRHLRAARLADPGEHVREPPARVVPVHDRGVRVRPGSPRRPTGCSCSTTTTASRGSSRRSTGCSSDTFGATPIVRHVDGDRRTPRRSPPDPRSMRSPAGRRPATSSTRHRPTATPRRATDDWPFLYLREPGMPPPLPRRSRAHRRAGRCCSSAAAAQLERHAAPPLQPALLRARDRVPPARDAQPRDVQPAVRLDVARQRARVLRHSRQRPAGDPRQRAASGSATPRLLYAALLVVDRGRVRAAAGVAAHRARLAALPASPASSRSRRSSSPTSCSATRSGTRGRPTWRSPRTSSARWSAARSSTWP